MADFSSSVPLETLRSALDTHVQSLRHELIELINRDYSDFVSLSTRLSGVEAAVERFQLPLAELGEKIAQVKAEVGWEMGE